MPKKMTLLAVVALAAVASAIPASAFAATDWTHNHKVVLAGSNFSQSFEGELGFTVAPPVFPVHSTFGCQVTIEINVTGPTAGSVRKFNPTTSTCKGTGLLAGCKLKTDKSNLPLSGWTITNGTTDLVVTHPTPGTNVTFLNEYEACPLSATHLEFAALTVVPTLTSPPTITSLNVSGTAIGSGAVLFGALQSEGGIRTLGLQ